MDYSFCAQTISLWQAFGYAYVVYKIAIPIILIAICITTLGRSILTTDEKEVKKNYEMMVKKIIIAILIFFVPAIISGIFGIVNGFDEVRSDYKICETCITHPKGNSCMQKVLAVRDDA